MINFTNLTIFLINNKKNLLKIILNSAQGGELFERIVELGYYSENMARNTIRELLNAIDYLHTQDIIHRVKYLIML